VDPVAKQRILLLIVASIAQIQTALNFLITQTLFVTVVRKYLNNATFSNDLLTIFVLLFCSARRQHVHSRSYAHF
jgi:hypothetical protein